MARLTYQQRKKMSSSEFVFKKSKGGAAGKGSYPIPDESHARNALSRVSQFGSSAEKSKVRAKVHAKFPGIGKGSEKRESKRGSK